MQVVILCGGRGSRLSEETDVRPKPMVEIGNEPMLWHIMSLYDSYGFKDFVLALGYKGDSARRGQWLQGAGAPALVANCATQRHQPTDEMERTDPLGDVIPYEWDLIHR